MTSPDAHLYHQSDQVTLYLGDARQVLSAMPAASADRIVTSPPYWALRDYGTGAWHGGDPTCPHSTPPACTRCAATWPERQQGIEPTLDAYLDRLLSVFDEIAHVLTPSGTVWLNLTDAYTSHRRRPPATTTKPCNGSAATTSKLMTSTHDHAWQFRHRQTHSEAIMTTSTWTPEDISTLGTITGSQTNHQVGRRQPPREILQPDADSNVGRP